MDDKNEKIVKELSTLLLSLTGCPGDSEKDSSFKVFKSFTGYLSETVKAFKKEDLLKLYSKKVENTKN